ncbi:hypothetical protein PCANC_26475 [Puccinia coronata f. sp. avenae]|uniref:G-protein coupled receptors family 1 profile domain-containing protein n=1 Tax=Puccinia coronata f. sp. avenae TaxID=200324 RepID=A0A2N5S154_9BASI|nr:hypothetical protein PCANC_26475 [Puccinia coronata f. sp. avenae]
MSSQTQEVLNFLTSLPPTVNPYNAMADKMLATLKGPRSPLWSRRLRVVVLVMYSIMSVQAAFLLYQRIRIRKSFRFQFNKMGLLVLDISDTSAVAYLIYAPLTVYVMGVLVALDQGRQIDEAVMICIYGHKFIPLVLAAFVWISACQCAQIFWDSNLASNMNRDKLKRTIQWTLSVFFVINIFGPLPLISGLYVIAYRYLNGIEHGAHEIVSRLRARGRHYDPETYNMLDLLTVLIPAQKLPPALEHFKKALNLSSLLYCLNLVALLSLYIPLLAICLSSLYRKSVSQSKIDKVIGSNGNSKATRISKKIQRERQRLVYHAVCVCLSVAIHIPPVAWKVFHSEGDYLHDPKWKEVSHQGVMAPFSFTGNMILFILNLHAHHTLAERHKKEQRTANNQMTTADASRAKTGGIKTLFLSQTEDEEYSLQNVDGRTMDEEKLNRAISGDSYVSKSLVGIKIKQSTFSRSS